MNLYVFSSVAGWDVEHLYVVLSGDQDAAVALLLGAVHREIDNPEQLEVRCKLSANQLTDVSIKSRGYWVHFDVNIFPVENNRIYKVWE